MVPDLNFGELPDYETSSDEEEEGGDNPGV
jgi:hypothetical protein